MSKLAEEVEAESEVGCCLTRMNRCHCTYRADVAGQVVARKLRKILEAASRGNAGQLLVEYIQQLERAE